MSAKNIIVRIVKKIYREFYFRTKYYQRFCAESFYKSSKYQKLDDRNRTDKRIIYYRFDKNLQYKKMLSQINIRLDKNRRFQHWLDTGLYVFHKYMLNGELSPDYSLILKNSLNDLLVDNKKKKNKIQIQNYKILSAIKLYIERIVIECKQNNIDSTYYENMLDKKAKTLEEAFQRIVFWSSLFWQSGHCLIGLGRLDYILKDYVGDISEDEMDDIIFDFYETMHDYYEFKSNALLGDTGQLIILGGNVSEGGYFCNSLTHAFIRVLIKYNKPDPKILLRVSNDIPQDLLELALKSIEKGNGSPLLSNDDVIIPSLQEFGYTREDSYNYITSACWEPFCYGKSIGNQNLDNINFAKCFTDLVNDENFCSINDFETLKLLYMKKVEKHVNDICFNVVHCRFEKNPLMTLFTEGCLEHNADISRGGAVYNDTGILSVGLANAIDSIFNIKRLCFDECNSYVLNDVKELLENNYQNDVNLSQLLSEYSYFGKDDELVVNFVKEIQSKVSEIVGKYTNRQNGKLKFGLSSPSYMDIGKNTMATADGRKNMDPLSVHMSCKKSIAYTELVNFASKLNYGGNKTNGNVLDFFVSPDFINNNFDKFLLFMKLSIKNGFYQMQMNVTSSKILIDARKNPEKYPALIVRVWGFSAYFNDLPEEYKELLIERAKRSETLI